MIDVKVICRFCRQEVGLSKYGSPTWSLAVHKARPDDFACCDGIAGPAIENVMPESKEALMSALTPSTSKTSPTKTENRTASNKSLSAPKDAIQERFEIFHRENPHVFSILASRALELQGEGVTKYGMDALWTYLRWHKTLTVETGEPYKISNDFRSRYARLLMQEVPALANFFEIRDLRSKGHEDV